jgi:alpha-N-arabinofuranosidase
MKKCLPLIVILTTFSFLFGTEASAQQTSLTLRLDQADRKVSPRLYGLMTEEINHSYDGGLYAELIRNRSFRDDPRKPAYWSVVAAGGAEATIGLDHQERIDTALPVCLRVEVRRVGSGAGIANTGYWGIPVMPGTTYQGSFFARAASPGAHPLKVEIQSTDGSTVYASAETSPLTNQWKQYHFSFSTAKEIAPTADARFVILLADTGVYRFNLISLFPPTYDHTPNGNRIDIMKLLAAMKPSFLRFPGGNYLEGDYFSTRFPWKKTLGPLSQRPGHPSCWGYYSTDGMGLLEYLEWCEDLHMEPLLAVFAGYTLKRDYLTGPFLKPFVTDALNEIEFVIGDTTTKWGALRAREGHPKPFDLHYVEVGNEDGFDRSGSYGIRFAQFFDAIKAKYPQLKVISTVGGEDNLGSRFPMKTRIPDVIDEHYYRNAWQMESDAGHYDHYSRTGPKIFVGEWATREGSPTTNFNAALGDAAWMTGMERNSDVVIMASYAPLFVNVNPGGMQWRSDLIGYNALTAYGSPSYYAQCMFSGNLGDRIVPVTASNLPLQTGRLSRRDSLGGEKAKTIPALFYSATEDSKDGTVYLKVVNVQGGSQTVHISLKGVSKVLSHGSTVTLHADDPKATNSITDPRNIVPQEKEVKGLGKSFALTLPSYSITVIRMRTSK